MLPRASFRGQNALECRAAAFGDERPHGVPVDNGVDAAIGAADSVRRLLL